MKTLLLPGSLLLFGCVSHPPETKAATAHSPAVAVEAPALATFRWSKGDEPVRMIRASEGFCFLTSIGGSFGGGGEHVDIRVEDGWWWLSGHCKQRSLWAEATCVTYAHADSAAR